MTSDSILDPAFMRKLERLTLAARRSFAGAQHGARPSVRRGSSLEFADYREYAPGDDLRYVDWNMAARSDKMFLKLFAGEEDLAIALLIDTSRSMGFGDPAKLRYAVQVAAALGYIGLMNYDRVRVQSYAGGEIAPLPAQYGKISVPRLFAHLENLKASGAADFADSLRRFAASAKQTGVAIILSDFLDPGWREGLNVLTARGFQVSVLHILSEEEITPELHGDLRLRDSETGEVKEISVTPELLVRYHLALDAFCSEIEGFCRHANIFYLRASTTRPFEEVVLQMLRQTHLRV